MPTSHSSWQAELGFEPKFISCKNVFFSTTLFRGPVTFLTAGLGWYVQGWATLGSTSVPKMGRRLIAGSEGVEARPDNQPHGKCFQHFRVHPPKFPKSVLSTPERIRFAFTEKCWKGATLE